MTIDPDQGPFEEDDVLTCNSDGYEPTYTWTGIVDGAIIVAQTGSTYTLPVGDFYLVCTATVSELTCTSTVTDTVEASAFGKYQTQLNIIVTVLTLMTVCVDIFAASNF